MGIISALEARSLEDPRTNLSDPAAWLWDALGAEPSASGITVTPEGSLSISTVWAAVRMISSTLATLPLPVYRRTDQGKEKARRHPLYKLLHDRPNPEMSAFQFRETAQAHLLLYGNAYSEIERNGAGFPVALWPIHPTSVAVERRNGRKVYRVRADGHEVPLKPEAIMHVPGFGLDGVGGLIFTSLAKDDLGHAKALTRFGSKFFANGAAPSGVLSHPGKLGPDSAERLRKSWEKLYSGLTNAQRVAILEEGMEYSPLGIAPEHAQFLESRKFSVAEIARWFLIPPNLVGDLERATWNNTEAMGIQYVTYCIEPWARRWEQVLNHDLFGADDEHFAEFDLRGLMRSDSAGRAAYYSTLINAGIMSVNEARELENLPTRPEGDALRAPLNTAPMGQEVEQDHAA